MAKIEDRPKEKMRLTIEFADNGIILRNPELKDEVTLALTEDYIDHSVEYRLIGKKIYDCLTGVVVPEYSGYLVTTGVELDITATLNGRRM